MTRHSLHASPILYDEAQQLTADAFKEAQTRKRTAGKFAGVEVHEVDPRTDGDAATSEVNESPRVNGSNGSKGPNGPSGGGPLARL